jgi:1-deoxyxylulose-5-phosphate synthase
MQKNRTITRREFLGRTAAGLAGALALPSAASSKPFGPKRSAADQVLLGQSGVTVSRLGIGTGSHNGRDQRDLGQDGFDRLVRHAMDRGVTFFDTADNYRGMHEMLGKALRGVDREKIQIQTKLPWGRYDDPLKELDRYRKEVGTDYFDSFLLHCTTTPDWPETLKRHMDLMGEARERQIIRSYGASAHGLPALRGLAGTEWPQVAFVRVNHNGHHMDGSVGPFSSEGNHNSALPHIRRLHEDGKGVIGMKLIGNGDFTDPAVRRRSIHYVMGLPFVDAVIIGFKSPAEIDEAIANMDEGLNQ